MYRSTFKGSNGMITLYIKIVVEISYYMVISNLSLSIWKTENAFEKIYHLGNHIILQ